MNLALKMIDPDELELSEFETDAFIPTQNGQRSKPGGRTGSFLRRCVSPKLGGIFESLSRMKVGLSKCSI